MTPLTRRPDWLLVFVAVCLASLAASSPVSAQRTKASVKSSALTAADLTAIHRAFRTSLNTPAVRDAAKAALTKQLRTVKPIAAVNGYWIAPVDVSAIYTTPAVRAGISTALPNASLRDRLADLSRLAGADRLGFMLVPNQFADVVIGEGVADIRGSLVKNLLQQNATDLAIPAAGAGAVVVAFGVGIAASLVAAAIWDWYTDNPGPVDSNTGLPIDDPNADPDGDGTPNRLDGDDDGDGSGDNEDSAPFDPGTQICYDCAWATVAFTNSAAKQFMSGAESAYRAAQTMSRSRAHAVSIGTIARVRNQAVGATVLITQ